ncbi:UNVERIFIED_CONTAM: hypothetical protein Slati_2725500 [Sesamum latifolium]|uniref:Uncharacterized protein n=1 Tax=Sesamum latifolium TaxID=2727402 RepID=A0AAW2VWY9_9LAMI
MASSNESVHFVGQNRPDEDPSEATSKRADSQSAGPLSGRRSLQQATASFRRLMDEQKEEAGGIEG